MKYGHEDALDRNDQEGTVPKHVQVNASRVVRETIACRTGKPGNTRHLIFSVLVLAEPNNLSRLDLVSGRWVKRVRAR
jgi:hypothetical protein